MSIRVASNAGAFYPAKKEEIEKMIFTFNELLETIPNIQEKLAIKPEAIISPHAGYIYSGFTANIAHRVLANKKVKRVVVIGPSHHVYFKGISISNFNEYQTPIKNLDIDLEYLEVMNAHFDFVFVPQAHKLEHSTETQMPFIAHYQPNVKVIELIYGDIDYKTLEKIITWLLEDELTSVVISSDLSHFYSQEKANILDSICLEGIAKENLEILDMGCEACGILGIKGLISSAKKLQLKSEILDYRTSGDITGDKSKVVGYASAAFYKG